jgi:hypothetical protein
MIPLVVKTRRKSPLAPGKEASDLNRKSRKSSASLHVVWCHPRGLRDLRLKMLAL